MNSLPSDYPSSKKPPTANNPFVTFQSRYWLLGWLAVIVILVIYEVLQRFQILPNGQEDIIFVPIRQNLEWTILAGVVVWRGSYHGLKLRPLLGQPQKLSLFSVLSAGLLVLSLMVFSMGCFSFFFLPISLLFPGFAERTLDMALMPGSVETNYPQLYEALTLFSFLVCAPLTEELIFRGILLQRWSTKWGLTWGIAASSTLFGFLHFTNPFGLTLFGFAMGLLYVRTRSLWVPIACHSLNNLGSVGLDWVSQSVGGAESYTLADVQAAWWQGLILIGVSAPLLVRFVWKSWPRSGAKIPYVLNNGGV